MSAEKPELRPCPFCGGEAFVSYINGEFAVECVDCECGTRYGKQDEAISAWNRRPHDGHTCGGCAEFQGDDKSTWCTHVRELVGPSDAACDGFESKTERTAK